MRRKRPNDFAPQLSSLRDVEQGRALPERLSWRAELAGLSFLRLKKPGLLQPTIYTGAHASAAGAGIGPNPYNRRPYVAQLLPTRDKGLLAVAGSNARVEIHELTSGQPDTHRLSLIPRRENLKLCSCAWSSSGREDRLFKVFENCDAVWEYDLETCSANRPTRRSRLFDRLQTPSGAQKHATDIIAVENSSVAVALGTGTILQIDRREPDRPAPFAALFSTRMAKPVIASEGMYLYAADMGQIIMFDKRVSPKKSSTSIVSFGRRESELSKQGQVARKDVGRNFHFNFLKVLPGAPAGCLVYHLLDGTTGFADMAGGSHSIQALNLLERGPQPLSQPAMDTLDEFGAADRNNHTWFLRRRYGEVAKAQGNRGWRVFVPLTKEPGLRVVSFGTGSRPRSFDFAKVQDVTSVHLVHGSSDRLLLGTAANTVDTYEVDWQSGHQGESCKIRTD